MNFYTHAAQGRIWGCILRSFQIPVFVSRSTSPSSRWNGTGAPWCPTCGTVVAAHLRKAEPIPEGFPQNLQNAAEMFCVKFTWCSLVASQGFLVCTLAHFCHAQAVKQIWGTAWREDTEYNRIGACLAQKSHLETETLDIGLDVSFDHTHYYARERLKLTILGELWLARPRMTSPEATGGRGGGFQREGECRGKWATTTTAMNFFSARLGSGTSTAGLRFQSDCDGCEFPVCYIVPPGQTPHIQPAEIKGKERD